jgi:hypothetical protein
MQSISENDFECLAIASKQAVITRFAPSFVVFNFRIARAGKR